MKDGMFHDFMTGEYVGVKDFLDPYGAKARRRRDEGKPPAIPLANRTGLGTSYTTGSHRTYNAKPTTPTKVVSILDHGDNVDLLSPGNMD